ncbi:phage tail terminator protein [Palleronia caenipelagi]|uniref:DUF3168 domain-containing protein n=1 Tax=Palleronia caenipelagi TaxID=2489174 RepID=A0A547PW43_9RHOB|nr:hypothetical protein [Palleronia caenipelagi]TRD18345.1 hypothetical protein FEV53_11865 [Palleronia caenipelagi]
MAEGFLDPQEVADRIRARVPALIFVGGAKDLGNATAETLRAPSAWVIVMAETADPPRYEICDLVEQPVTIRFGVVLAVRDIADRTGEAAREALGPVREALHRALTGWQPLGSGRSCLFDRGSLASGIGQDGMMFWQDEFLASFDRRITLEG